MKRAFSCITFLLYLLSPLKAQDPHYLNFTINEGLPSSNIYSVYQDDKGIIWFSTDVGIVRYDSRQFQLFNTDNGLSDNEVFRMFRDHKGRIWQQTLNGKASYIYQNRIYNEHNSPFLKKAGGSGLSMHIFEDRQKNIYITYRNGEISVIDTADNVRKIKTENKSLAGLWQYRNHLYYIHSQAVVNLSNQSTARLIPDKTSYRVLNLNGQTYLAKKNIIYQPNDSSISALYRLGNEIDITYIRAEGNRWWICTRSGLILFEDGRTVQHYFKDAIVSDILRDREGNYWISTLNKGILFVPDFGIRQSLKDDKINCIGKRSETELWFGNFSNNYYIFKDGQFRKEELGKGLDIDKITNIRFYGDTALIIGKMGMRIQTNSFSKYFGVSANDVLFDGPKVYYASTSLFELNTDIVINQRYSEVDHRMLLGKRSNILCKDDRGGIYIGTNLGLYYSFPNQKLQFLGESNEDLQTGIEDIYFDKKSDLLYVATTSKGLIVLKDGKTFQKINTSKGLNSNTVLSIKAISENTFLTGSNNGLNKLEFSVAGIRIDNLNALLGLKNKRIKDIETYKDSACLATENGIITFALNLIKARKPIPICLINGIEGSRGSGGDNIFNYENNDLTISFSGVSYIDRGDVIYHYKLDKDKQWSASKETRINYQSLPAGKYKFYVYCVNSLKEKSEIVQIQFEILPPYWQKWWFILLSGGLFFWLLYKIIRSRFNKQKYRLEQEKLAIKTQRDKARLEKQMLELEQKALRMQMNPHFIFNALNTIKGYYSAGDNIQASTYISKFSRLLRNLLENEEQVASLDNEIEMLKLYIELTQLRYEGVFEYQIEVSDELSPDQILLPNLLLQPLVENAIIHGLGPKGGNGILKITFRTENSNLICEVEDNGIGRAAAGRNRLEREHQSKAMDITMDRIKLFDEHASFIIEDKFKDGISDGTKAVISLKLKKKW